MSFQKMGKAFPGKRADQRVENEVGLAGVIATALKKSLGSTHAAIKTMAAWTGANERTAKNWISGRYAPSGQHLVGLARHSDEVLEAILTMAGRTDLIAWTKLAQMECLISDLLEAVRTLTAHKT